MIKRNRNKYIDVKHTADRHCNRYWIRQMTDEELIEELKKRGYEVRKGE